MQRIRKSFVTVLALLMAVAVLPFFGANEVEAAAKGKWVLTKTNVYTPSRYTNRSNNYYKYTDSYKGIKNGYAVFKTDGGYKGPGDWFTCTMTHKCSVPKSSYAPGAKVTLTIKTQKTNVINNCNNSGASSVKLRPENTSFPNDGRSKFFFNNMGDTNVYTNFRTDTWKTYAAAGETEKVFAYMPTEAKNGDKTAIVFITNSSADSMGNNTYKNQYGGYQFVEWIYTYKIAPSKGIVSSIKNISGAKAKVTVKKVSGAKNYQIKYQVAGTGKWVTRTGTKNTFSISVPKGKKVTVKARVKNAIGWGAWGKAKSLTTDKK